MIFMSASIFMTVAIAMERYVAVHYPIDYNQVITNGLKTQLYYFLKLQFNLDYPCEKYLTFLYHFLGNDGRAC